MPANSQQAYAGQATQQAGNDETNRLDFVVRSVLNKLATATLVIVKAVGEGTVDVQPMVAQIDGAGNAIPHGTIYKVPVFRLLAGASAVYLEPVVGDIGLAVFAHSDISSAKQNKKPSNPGSRRRFDWSDALYLGGFLGPAPTQYVKLGPDGVTIQAADGQPVTVTAPGGANINGVTIDSDGNVSVPGTLAAAGMTTLDGKDFLTHTHTGVQTGSGTSGPVA